MTDPTAAARELLAAARHTLQADGTPDRRLLCEALNALEAEVLAAEQRGRDAAVPAWQPIETAPKDGTRILVGAAGTRVMFAQWLQFAHGGDWAFEPGCIWIGGPTHWQPLPAAPQPKEISDGDV